MKRHLAAQPPLFATTIHAGVAHTGMIATGRARPFLGPDDGLAGSTIGWPASRLFRHLVRLPLASVVTNAHGAPPTLRCPEPFSMGWCIVLPIFTSGLALLARARPSGQSPVVVACCIVLFGFAHSNAQVIEGHPGEENVSTEFTLATALLQSSGYGLVLALARRRPAWTKSARGTGMALCGLIPLPEMTP